MIIAAYAGCGKTTLAEKYSDICIDVTSMPFARILPVKKEETLRNFEAEKAVGYHVDNPIYPYNMIVEVLELEKKYKYVIIPTVQKAIDILQKEYGRSIILCYPEDGLEKEYRERYLQRGNTESFCKIFADGMQEFLEGLKENKEAYHLRLKSGEYLTDKFDEFEDIGNNFPAAILKQDKIEELKQSIQEKKTNIWLTIHFLSEKAAYQVKDVDDAEERQFIYDFGKRLYQCIERPLLCSLDFDIREIHPEIRIVDRDGLLEALERENQAYKLVAVTDLNGMDKVHSGSLYEERINCVAVDFEREMI